MMTTVVAAGRGDCGISRSVRGEAQEAFLEEAAALGLGLVDGDRLGDGVAGLVPHMLPREIWDLTHCLASS